MQEGGWIVSQPDTSPVRLECPMDSQLPELLRGLGYNLQSGGIGERLMPFAETLKEHGRTNTITRQQVGVGIVGLWQLDLRCIFAANAETRTCAGIC
jgi:hypothetical protein